MTKLIEFQNKNGDTLRGILNDTKTDHIAVFVHGFERTAVTEKKFKDLADALYDIGISSFRFDITGSGLSDGDFKHMTVASMAGDLKNAVSQIEKYGKRINVVAHSLGGCSVAKYLTKGNNNREFDKIVLLAPALNQKELLRFWFATSVMKKEDSSLKITWENFKQYLDENKFIKDCERQDKTARTHYVSSDYFLENKDKDYSGVFKNTENILHVHGDADIKVPLESLDFRFKNEIIVKGGDHDIEHPNMIEQWILGVVAFLR